MRVQLYSGDGQTDAYVGLQDCSSPTSNYGLYGYAGYGDENYGVYGKGYTNNTADSSFGVYGEVTTAPAVGGTGFAIYGTSANATAGTNWAGYFDGDVRVTGKLTVDGGTDPTYVSFTPQPSEPMSADGVSDPGIWVRDTDEHLMFTNTGGDVDITAASGGIPSGGIIMWSGALADIPAGWHLCDGTSGTPDLRDRFILGTSAAEDPGATGGSNTHTHTVDVWGCDKTGIILRDSYAGEFILAIGMDFANCPNSMLSWAIKSTEWGGGCGDEEWDGSFGAVAGKRETTASASNVPPYYKLAFIMKL